jgi:hypothetical protein
MKQFTSFSMLMAMVLITSVSLIGCQKKRSAKLGDGEGRFSESVSKYDGKVFKLETLEPKGKGGIISTSESFEVDVNTKKMKTFPAVNYKTDVEIISDVLILGKPNTKNIYEIHYKLTNSHLVVSKVAPEDYIPFQEKTYADTLSDGRLSVPLFGYPIVAKVVREIVKNDRNENTSRITERSVTDIAQAQYVQIDFTRGQIFDAVKKIDTFPVSYFTGDKGDVEWYFASTILNTPDKSAGNIGWSSAMSFMGVSENILKFQRVQNGLEGVSLALDSKAKDNSGNYKKIVMLPGVYKEFKVEKDGRFKQLRESQESNDRISWQKTEYIELDLARIAAPLLTSRLSHDEKDQSLVGLEVSGMKLVELVVQDDFFTFIVENMKSNIRIQLAFRKKPVASDYKPLVYHAEDNKLFGLMNTRTNMFQDYRIRRDEDYAKLYKVSRFHPNKNNEIVYHLSKSTQDSMIPSAQKAVDSWNRVFERETGIKVRLVTQPKVNTGDIRFNVLNFIDTKTTEMGLGGFGPTITDNDTGEIISATSTMHVNTYRTILISTIRQYVLGQTGAIPNYFSSISSHSTSSLISSTRKFLVDKFGQDVDKNKNWNDKLSFLKDNKLKFYNQIKHPELKSNALSTIQAIPEQPVMTVPDNVELSIKKYCPEVFTYVQQLSQSKRQHDENELVVIENCAEKMLGDAIVSTIVHEMGHNFGLRHNFAGSSDFKNFPKDSNGKIRAYTSSVMDYIPSNFEDLAEPGPYDVAAIKYAYAGVVKLNNSHNFKIKHRNKSLRENLNGRLELLNNYKFCDEYDAYYFNNDPMCQAHDIGWTPELSIRNSMKEVNKAFTAGTNKFDKSISASAEDVPYYMYHYANSMLNHYNFWRTKLAEFMNQEKVHLVGVDTGSYAEILDRMSKHPTYGKIYQTYKAPKYNSEGKLIESSLIDQMYGFMTRYVFLPDQYCLFETSNKELDFVEFNQFRKKVFSSSKVSIKSCSDQAALQVLEKENTRFITQFGYSASNIRFDLSDNSEYNTIHGVQSYDVVSSLPARDLMSALVTMRSTLSLRGSEMGLVPSFLDEPDYRADWFNRFFARITDGVSTREILSSQPQLAQTLKKQNLLEKFVQKNSLQLFRSEKQLYDRGMLYTFIGLQVPGFNTVSPDSRISEINGSLAQQGSGGVPLEVGYEYIPGGPIAEKVAKLYTRNRILDGSDPKSFIDFIKSLELPETNVELSKLSVKELNEKFEKIDSAIKSITGDNSSQAKQITEILLAWFPEIIDLSEDFQAYSQKMNQELNQDPVKMKSLEGLSGEERAKKMQELVKPYLDASASKILSKFKPFSMEQKIKDIELLIKTRKKQSEELSSQQDLFLRFMIKNW